MKKYTALLLVFVLCLALCACVGPAVDPVTSEGSEPAKSEAAEPVKSDAEDPAKSEGSEPAKSEAAEPVKSDAEEPAKSEGSEPVKSEGQEETSLYPWDDEDLYAQYLDGTKTADDLGLYLTEQYITPLEESSSDFLCFNEEKPLYFRTAAQALMGRLGSYAKTMSPEGASDYLKMYYNVSKTPEELKAFGSYKSKKNTISFSGYSYPCSHRFVSLTEDEDHLFRVTVCYDGAAEGEGCVKEYTFVKNEISGFTLLSALPVSFEETDFVCTVNLFEESPDSFIYNWVRERFTFDFAVGLSFPDSLRAMAAYDGYQLGLAPYYDEDTEMYTVPYQAMEDCVNALFVLEETPDLKAIFSEEYNAATDCFKIRGIMFEGENALWIERIRHDGDVFTVDVKNPMTPDPADLGKLSLKNGVYRFVIEIKGMDMRIISTGEAVTAE